MAGLSALFNRLTKPRPNYILQQPGFCPICEKDTTFRAEHDWFRDHLLCSRCHSLPRERALMVALDETFPDYRELAIHESSPGGRGVSVKLHHQCKNYSASHFYPDVAPGMHHRSGYRCENLEALTFDDNAFDIFITQDVMEHIFNPTAVFTEVCRVLKPGGAHIFTVPIVNKWKSSAPRASRQDDGTIRHLAEAQYHGNPVDAKGSLVTHDWGYDIAHHITRATGMSVVIKEINDLARGILAEYIDVVVAFKPTETA